MRWVELLISAIFGGGLVSALAAIFKLKPEGDQIIVSAAKDVVIVQKGVLDDLRTEMARMQTRFEERETLHLTQLAECEARERELRGRVEALESRS